MKPHELKKKFLELVPDYELLESLIKKNQKEYIRKRLRAIKLLWEGHTITEIKEKLDINKNTTDNWVKIIVENGVEEGLKKLAMPIKINKDGKLNQKQ